MGKNIIQQKRGKGSPTYRSPSFRFRGAARHAPISNSEIVGKVVDIVDCPGHSAPLAEVKYGEKDVLMIAPEGIRVGDNVVSGPSAPIAAGNSCMLKNIPDGTYIYNIESMPGDGGKFCRSSGVFARLLSKHQGKVLVELPSQKKREFLPECRATIGIVAGGGRPEKPFYKAGRKFYAKKAKNKLYPIVCGLSMNAVNHPFGGRSSKAKGNQGQVSRNAPPGKKVGKIAPRRTGRRKR